MLIVGAATAASSGHRIDAVNPFAGEVFATFPDAGAVDVDAAVVAGRQALEATWGRPILDRV